jgi:acyl carrier protein
MTNKEKVLTAFKAAYSNITGEDFDEAKLPETIDHGAFDSLDQIELVMALEYDLGISIDEAEAEKCPTYQALLDMVTARLGPDVPA